MFTPHKRDTGALQPWENIPAAAGTYQVGQLLNVTDGKLAAISAAETDTPAYLSMYSGTVADGQMLPVIRVNSRIVFETALTAEAAAAKVGSKLQVSAGGLGVDAAATGSFEITYIEDTAAGSRVCGRFI